jgi:putative oxidoreductase
MTAAGLLILRLGVAVVLVAHGAHQLSGMFGGPGVGPGGLTVTAERFASIGLEPGFLLAVLAGTIQLTAGLLVAAGLLTRWAAIAALVYLGLMIWKAHLPWGFFANWLNVPGRGHGVELALVLTAALLCLMLSGAGDWSLDGRRARAAASRASGRARLRRG